MTDDEIVQDVKDRFDAVASTRGNWESVWEQIAERIFRSTPNSLSTGQQGSRT